MSDNKKYYYLKMKENFFDTEEMKILESQKNGIEYQNLYLKCCLLSLKADGKLIFKDCLPYDVTMLSTVLRVNIDTVKTGIEIFQHMGLVEILDSGMIYMSDIQSLIGHSSTEAERKREYRDRIEDQKKRIGTTNGTMSGQCLPELELDLKKELKKEKEERAPTREDPPNMPPILKNWYHEYFVKSARLLSPSEEDRKLAVSAMAQLNGNEALAEQCVAYYWREWRNLYFAYKQSSKLKPPHQRESEWTFRGFAKNITACIPPKAEPIEMLEANPFEEAVNAR